MGRRANSWRTTLGGASANTELATAMRPLRDRSRELVRNTPHANRMLDILCSHTVGTGILPVSNTGSDRIDKQVDQLWADWVAQADVTDRESFDALQVLAVRAMIESGEVVARYIDRELDEKLPVPMQLQILEADFIDQARDGIYSGYAETKLYGVRKTRLGVGLGEFDRWMGLWLWPEHPGEVTAMVNVSNYNSEFIPRIELLHMFRRLRPGQIRGVPWFAPILTTARDLSDYIDACNVKAKAEACFAAFVTNDDSTARIFDEQDQGTETLEPGTIKELRVGQDIKFAQPTSTSQAETVLMFDLQAMAAGVGCTYDQATGDLRQANYSSLRAGKLDFWRLITQLQKHVVIPKFCAPVRARFIERAILSGRLRDRAYPCEWVVPAKEAIDPKKDLDAEIHEVRAGRVTPQQFIAARGNNWRRNIDEFETFFDLAHEREQIFDIDASRVDQRGRQPSVAGGAGAAGNGGADAAATAEDIAQEEADQAAEDAAADSRLLNFSRR